MTLVQSINASVDRWKAIKEWSDTQPSKRLNERKTRQRLGYHWRCEDLPLCQYWDFACKHCPGYSHCEESTGGSVWLDVAAARTYADMSEAADWVIDMLVDCRRRVARKRQKIARTLYGPWG